MISEQQSNGACVLSSFLRRRLMHLEGCCEHHLGSVRYSHFGDVAAVHFLVRPGNLHRYLNNPEQTPRRA